MNKKIEFLKKCDRAYHNTGKPLISDREYDILKTEAMFLFPDDPYFQTVGATPTQGDNVELPYVLGSLNKTKPDGSLSKWIADNKLESVVVSDKLDGVSVYVKYEKGEVSLASTRGDGYIGKNITDKIKRIVPTINKPFDIEVRGEVVMTPENCRELGYSLPRSAVSGILNGEEQEHYDKCQYLDVIFYAILSVDDIKGYTNFIALQGLGLKTPEYKTFTDFTDIENGLVNYYKERKSQSEIDIDGLVVCDFFDISVGNDYYPLNMVAFKVNEDAVEVEVTNIEWNVKRTGKITPVVNFTPVNMSGSMVSKATGFNKKFIVDNNIHVGSRITIVKSGDIIPYIIECLTREDIEGVMIPKHCPSCGEVLGETSTGVDLLCHNEDCPDRILFKIEHFLLAHDVEEVTYVTLKRLGVTCIEDLYTLNEFDISSIEGMGMKRAKTILEQIDKTLKTTPEKLLQSFGIAGIGSTVSKDIIGRFQDFDKLFDLTVDDFIGVNGIGRVLAGNLVHYLKKYKGLYQFLLGKGLKFEEKESNKLQGKLLTLTGKSDINRNDLTKMIVANGGIVKGISKNVDLLVTNDINSNSSKTKKAKQYGIEIITYEDLLNIIEV